MESDTINLIQAGTYTMDGVQHLGVTLIGDGLRFAFMNLASADTQRFDERAQYALNDNITKSMAFVKGSGLEVAIQTFGLQLDADELRRSFYEYCETQRRSGDYYHNLPPLRPDLNNTLP